MEESLSRALVAFYPLAGRLKMNDATGRYEIDCSGEGALFDEAETTRSLDEMKKNDELWGLMVPRCDYSKGLGSFPLLMVKLTRFKCRGVCLGFAVHHYPADGSSNAKFINCWARLARGLDIGVMPVHDRQFFVGPRHPPLIKFRHFELQPPLPPLPPKDSSGKECEAVECEFKLSKHEIDALKEEALRSKDTPNKLSTFEILAGHVWRCATKARGLTGDQDVKLHIPVTVRAKGTNLAGRIFREPFILPKLYG